MENKENMEKCPEFIISHARKDMLLGNEVVFCYAKVCPYNKEIITSLSGESITLCAPKGLLKKTELYNPDKTKKSNESTVYPQSNLPIGNLSKVNYIQFK